MSRDADHIDCSLWRRLFLNRFVATPVVILLIALGWNAWVSLHDNGIVEGRVVDRHGAAVAGATVALWAHQFTTYTERQRTTTDAEGRFRFEGNASHSIQISAEKVGVGRTGRIPVRLYFRAQDVAVRSPLRLED